MKRILLRHEASYSHKGKFSQRLPLTFGSVCYHCNHKKFLSQYPLIGEVRHWEILWDKYSLKLRPLQLLLWCYGMAPAFKWEGSGSNPSVEKVSFFFSLRIF